MKWTAPAIFSDSGSTASSVFLPPDPFIKIEIPKELNLDLITDAILRDYNAAIATPRFGDAEQGSNNWVVDGSMTATGKPMLASDPHRPVTIPSLRKTWHLVAPGINVFGAGEPACPASRWDTTTGSRGASRSWASISRTSTSRRSIPRIRTSTCIAVNGAHGSRAAADSR
jgi:hypothetical protein